MREDGEGALLLELVSAVGAGEPVALATVVDTGRSVPRHAGTKMLVFADGRILGTVGGGAMEARVIDEARASLGDERPRLIHYDLRDLAKGDPGVCGGEAAVYVEPHLPPPTVLVVGCGHVGRAVVELAHWLGYRVVATDDRTELVSRDALPDADVLVPAPIDEALKASPVTANTYVAVVSRGMPADVELLPALLASPARSIGVIGSHRRWRATRRELLARGVDAEELDRRVKSPIGLDIHAETPREIAVSILGEITALRRCPSPR